jgi:glucan 1,3-beta-glucosidase
MSSAGRPDSRRTGPLGSSANSASVPSSWVPIESQFEGAEAAVKTGSLQDELQSTLLEGIHGFCFSPYLDGQGPDTVVEAPQIRERMAIIAPHTKWIRTFSCCKGSELIPAIAHEYGLKTLVGAWLGADLDINEQEIQGVIELGRLGYADRIAVGNEVLLREDMSEDQLLTYIERVKQALPNIEVGYVDAYYLFEKHSKITAACDVVFANCYPFWEGCERGGAIEYMQSMVQRTLAVAGGRPVVISETGWPDKGSAFHGAKPSPDGAMAYFIDSCRWSEAAGIELFYFSAFDEAWKVGAEGDVGAYWGIWDAQGQSKYRR